MVQYQPADVAPVKDVAQAAQTRDHDRVFDAFWSSPQYCTWCFRQTRAYYPEFENDRRDYLEQGGGGNHLLVISATSDAAPGTYQEVVPPKTDAYGQVIEPPRPKTICDGCARIDIDPSEQRSTADLLDCIRHMAAELHREYIPFSERAAERFIHAARQHDSLAGHDEAVLRRATKCGLRFSRYE